MFAASIEHAFGVGFDQPIGDHIWRLKYQYQRKGEFLDKDVTNTWHRVANALALGENEKAQARWERTFYEAFEDFRLLPAGRILSGAGTARDVTLFNTFVMRTIPDSIDGIMDTMKEAARTMQMGGGIGFDFSTLRPSGSLVNGLDCPAAGPLGAMDIADAICNMLVTGMGRGAMMATLAADHPDILSFVKAKSNPRRFRNFNLSVLVPDRLIEAVENNAPWHLIWQGKVVQTLPAVELWQAIMQQTYDTAEPGVLFVDRINANNPLNYIEDVSATNSCAEQPLPPYGACPLASVNLARLVEAPFTPRAALDRRALKHLVSTAVRMLDNVLEVSRYPVPAQKWEVMNKRRIGVGITGLGNALIMMGARYGSDQAVSLVNEWLGLVQNSAYRASALLAAERGPFPMFDPSKHLKQAPVQRLDPDVRRMIAAYGLRNGALTTIAPTGTISMFASNVSSGIEPVFAASYKRKVTLADGAQTEEVVQDYAAWLFHRLYGANAPLPPAYVTAQDLSPKDHVAMQAAAQVWIDSGISKTVNCPEDIPFAEFEAVYRDAYARGCKGCTTFRPNAVTGTVLSA